MTMVKPITCRKCKGSGTYMRASGMPDSCSWCVGAGVVEGDKATNDARKARQAEFTRLYPILMELARKAPIFGRTFSTSAAFDALALLADKEPARYAKAVASLEAGHPQVVQALSDYFFANR
jgi:hypothetical protein